MDIRRPDRFGKEVSWACSPPLFYQYRKLNRVLLVLAKHFVPNYISNPTPLVPNFFFILFSFETELPKVV